MKTKALTNAGKVAKYLSEHGIPAAAVISDDPDVEDDEVRVGTDGRISVQVSSESIGLEAVVSWTDHDGEAMTFYQPRVTLASVYGDVTAVIDKLKREARP